MNQAHTSRITTHVLDAATGVPAEGVPVELSGRVDTRGEWDVIAEGTTDADGRIMRLGGDDLPPGEYRIRFDTGAYFRARNAETFYPEAVVTFIVTDDGRHVHVPLLLSPFAYSTYRGS
ncbi:MAG TPA: hydroxyisourate hydrolase [Agromyces sp.]|jgi:5-hydroxyisourate hydrolase